MPVNQILIKMENYYRNPLMLTAWMHASQMYDRASMVWWHDLWVLKVITNHSFFSLLWLRDELAGGDFLSSEYQFYPMLSPDDCARVDSVKCW